MAKRSDRRSTTRESSHRSGDAIASEPSQTLRDGAGGVITFRVNAEELSQLEQMRQRLRLESVNVTARALLQATLLPSARLIDVSTQLEQLVDAIESTGPRPQPNTLSDEKIRLQLARAFATLFVNLGGPAKSQLDPADKDAAEARLEKARRAFRQCFELDG